MLKLLHIKKISPSQKKELIKLFSTKVDNYTTSITFLNKREQKDFLKRCNEIKTYDSYEFNVNYENYDVLDKTPFIIFLKKKTSKRKY